MTNIDWQHILIETYRKVSMARGKNQAIAERRKAAISEIGSIDSLKLRVKTLEEELEKAKRRYESSLEAKNENIRELSRKLKEETTDELEEAKEFIERLKIDLGESRMAENSMRKKWVRLIDVITDHYEKVHGVDRLDVLGSLTGVEDGVTDVIGETNVVIADNDLIAKAKQGKLSNAQVKLLQKKRRGLL